jgi:phosphatidylglycerophosphate synthase
MAGRTSYRVPNSIIGGRVALAFLACALLMTDSRPAALTAIGLTALALAMDALDGIAARRMGLTSKLGGMLDITADRIVENVYWITFAVLHVVPLWVPVVVMTRSVLVDAVRGLALVQGRTAFGDESMARTPLSRFLTGSRAMRNAYGFAKVAAFMLLGVRVATGADGASTVLPFAAAASVAVAVVLCVVRGIPVLAEAGAYLEAESATAGG